MVPGTSISILLLFDINYANIWETETETETMLVYG